MGKVKPISPDEIKIELPDFVIEAVNEMIKRKYRGGSFSFKAKELIALRNELNLGPKDKDWYQEKWMDFEEVFRESGWNVRYDRPGYNENYDDYYEFTPKKK